MNSITIMIDEEKLLPLRDSEGKIIGDVKVPEKIMIGKIESWKPSDSRKSPESKIEVNGIVFK
jgi:hypothetical protein